MDSAKSNSSNIVWRNDCYEVFVCDKPFTPGVVGVRTKSSTNAWTVMDVKQEEFIELLLFSQKIVPSLLKVTATKRIAMVAGVDPMRTPVVKLIPLHGLAEEWSPMLSDDPEYHATYPGYITSKNGPRMPDSKLDSTCERIRKHLQSREKGVSHVFHGEPTDTNLFARIVRGEEQQWRIWENADHVAFLTPFPSSPAFSVVVPRRHLSSDIFSLAVGDYVELLRASYRVAELLKSSVPGAVTCALIFEGYEINYAHAKVVPIVGGSTTSTAVTDYCEVYKGYVTSLEGSLVDAEKSQKLASMLATHLQRTTAPSKNIAALN